MCANKQYQGSLTYDWHASDQCIDDSDPGCAENHFANSNVSIGCFAINSTKGEGRGDHRDEEEKGDGDSFLVQVGDLLDPVRPDGVFDISDNPLSPDLGRFIFDFSESMFGLIGGHVGCLLMRMVCLGFDLFVPLVGAVLSWSVFAWNCEMKVCFCVDLFIQNVVSVC